jgi:hypothetical protein
MKREKVMSQGKGALAQYNKCKVNRNKHKKILNKCEITNFARNLAGGGIYQKKFRAIQTQSTIILDQYGVI